MSFSDSGEMINEKLADVDFLKDGSLIVKMNSKNSDCFWWSVEDLSFYLDIPGEVIHTVAAFDAWKARSYKPTFRKKIKLNGLMIDSYYQHGFKSNDESKVVIPYNPRDIYQMKGNSSSETILFSHDIECSGILISGLDSIEMVGREYGGFILDIHTYNLRDNLWRDKSLSNLSAQLHYDTDRFSFAVYLFDGTNKILTLSFPDIKCLGEDGLGKKTIQVYSFCNKVLVMILEKGE